MGLQASCSLKMLPLSTLSISCRMHVCIRNSYATKRSIFPVRVPQKDGFCVSCPRTSTVINQCLGAVDQLRGCCDSPLSSVHDNHCCQKGKHAAVYLQVHMSIGANRRIHMFLSCKIKYLSSPPSPKRTALQEAFIPTSIP